MFGGSATRPRQCWLGGNSAGDYNGNVKSSKTYSSGSLPQCKKIFGEVGKVTISKVGHRPDSVFKTYMPHDFAGLDGSSD